MHDSAADDIQKVAARTLGGVYFMGVPNKFRSIVATAVKAAGGISVVGAIIPTVDDIGIGGIWIAMTGAIIKKSDHK